MQPITIENQKSGSKLIVNPHGARIEELVLDGQKIFVKTTRGDGKEGSSHPCIPQFNKETITSFDLPQHGSARNKDWGSAVTDGSIILSLDIEDGKYPKGLSAEQEHSLTDEEYRLITTASNNSDQDLPVNFAEHFYWDAPNGWEGIIINGVDVTEIVKKDAPIEALPENEILIPGQKPTILTQKGFSVFQLWAQRNEQTGEYDQNYVCIEPAEGDRVKDFFGSDLSMIRPHESRATEITVSLKEV